MAGETTDNEKKIIRQIEYYFGDSNLPRDRFLQEEIRKDEGWVPLDTMIKFNRLKQMSDDIKVICEAMKKSNSGLIEVNEEEMKIRRSPDKPIPENTEQRRHDLSAKTVYAKEFPLDATLDEVQELFEKYGEVESVFMRKNEKKLFKGSVFTTYKTDDGVQAFLKAESVTFRDKEVENRKLKSDYFKGKNEEKKQVQQEKEKKRLDAKNRQDEDGKKKIENQMVKGALLHLAGIAKDTTREDIKNLLQDYGPIAWVEFNKGETDALVRYDQENQAKEVLEKVLADTNEIKLNETKVEGRVLEGEEEVQRWVQMYETMRERRFSYKKKGKPWQNQQYGSRKRGKRPSKGRRDEQKAQKGDSNGADRGDSDGGDSDGGNDSRDEPPVKQTNVEKSEEPPVKQTNVEKSEEPPVKKAKVEESGE